MLHYNNKTVFSKLTNVINGNQLNNIIKKYNSDYRVQHFDTKSHVYSLLYLQLSTTDSLKGLIDELSFNHNLKKMINIPSLSYYV